VPSVTDACAFRGAASLTTAFRDVSALALICFEERAAQKERMLSRRQQ
jgi:hypothetical protein